MRTAILGAVMVVSVAALTSCTSETTSGQPQPASSTAGSSAPTSVDVAALDSGDYSTEPRRLAPPATSNDDLLRVESQRMAEFTTLPAEIDPTLTAGSSGATFTTNEDFKAFFSNDDRAFNALTKDPNTYGFSAGFRGFASDPNSQFPEDATSLRHGVMRFATAKNAVDAARVLSESRTKPVAPDNGDIPFASVSVPTLPGTLVTSAISPNPNGDRSKDTVYISAITAHSTYVIADEFQVIPAVRDAAIAALSRSLALQKPLIDKFPRTRSRDGKATIVVDQNKILLYTLPDPATDDKLNDSVLGPRGIAFANADPVGTMQLLTEVGSLHNAYAGSRVFRADTAAGAQKIAAHQTGAGAAPKADVVKPAAAPQGLPQVTCILVRGRPQCDVTVGRYVGETYGEDLTDAHRQAVAQYKVLLKADQNAN